MCLKSTREFYRLNIKKHLGLRNGKYVVKLKLGWCAPKSSFVIELHFRTTTPKNTHSKECVFFYPSHRLGISSPRGVRSISPTTAEPLLYLITRQRVFSCGLMIYNTSCWWYTMLRIDDIHAYRRDFMTSCVDALDFQGLFVFLWVKNNSFHHCTFPSFLILTCPIEKYPIFWYNNTDKIKARIIKTD